VSNFCNNNVAATDGNYTEWTTWSDCDVTCGGGVQSRSRKCTNPAPQHGGKSCEDLGPANQTLKCNTSPCREYTSLVHIQCYRIDIEKTVANAMNAVHEVVTPSGIQRLSCILIGCVFYGMVHVQWLPVTASQDYVPYVMLSYHWSFLAIDGNYTEWSKWSDCSVTCGGGKQKRSRNCTNPPPKHGGKNCDDLGPDSESLECNPDPCREYLTFDTWMILELPTRLVKGRKIVISQKTSN